MLIDGRLLHLYQAATIDWARAREKELAQAGRLDHLHVFDSSLHCILVQIADQPYYALSCKCGAAYLYPALSKQEDKKHGD